MIAVGAAVAIASAGITAAGANAATPTAAPSATQEYQMGPRQQYEQFYWEDNPVGAATTTVVFETSRAAVGPTVHCDLYTDIDGQTASKAFSAAEWIGSPSPQIEVKPGALAHGGGAGCTSGDPAAAGWSLTWELRRGSDNQTVTLAEFNGPTLLNYDAVDHYFETGDARTLAAGDVVTISSDAVGTWPRDRDGDYASRSARLQSTDPSVPALRIDDVSVDDFGKTLTVRLPDPLPEGFAGKSARLTATSTSGFYEPSISFTTEWSADVSLAQADATSTITVRTTRQVGISRERLTAVARVEAGGASPTGSVEFVVDGQSAGSATLKPTESGGSATLRLPRLGRGTHTLTTTYSGADEIVGSTSAPVRVYIVI